MYDILEDILQQSASLSHNIAFGKNRFLNTPSRRKDASMGKLSISMSEYIKGHQGNDQGQRRLLLLLPVWGIWFGHALYFNFT